MLAIQPMQRKFVIALLDNPRMNHCAAARAAGYSQKSDVGPTAYRLSHNPKIQLAIQEEARNRIKSNTVLAASVLVEIAQGSHSDATRLKAAAMLLNRGGLPEVLRTENIHEHNHTMTVEQARRRIAALLEKDPELKSQIPADMITDVEFTEVTDGREGLEDLL